MEFYDISWTSRFLAEFFSVTSRFERKLREFFGSFLSNISRVVRVKGGIPGAMLRASMVDIRMLCPRLDYSNRLT